GGGDVLDQLAEVAAVELRASRTGRSDEANSEPLVIGHRDDRRFPIAGETCDTDLFGINGFVGLEVIDGPAGAPRPRAERAPVLDFTRLPFVAQTNDPARQSRTAVGLHAVG